MIRITDRSNYIGRFAPSPSGLLHLGSLYTALASYLIAKSQQGLWLVRIEDIDPPREMKGAASLIIESLVAHGLLPDQTPTFQSHHTLYYQRAIEQLQQAGNIYPCTCNRQRLSQFNGLYDRRCLDRQNKDHAPAALRFKTPAQSLSFSDKLQGLQLSKTLPKNLHNDFIVKRKDGLWAYQLAMVVDDIRAGITEVVRGTDLLDNTTKQLALYHAFKATPPQHLHLPVLCTSPGMKLSKQNHAKAIQSASANHNLVQCLQLLGQHIPSNAEHITPQQLVKQAVLHFNFNKIPQQAELIL